MTSLLIVLTAVLGGAFVARFVPTEELLQERFALGQRYYAANDHSNAVQVFEEIESTPNYALLDVDAIEVAVDEERLPLRVAAIYQLGNSYRNVGQTRLDRAASALAEGDSAVAARRRAEAEEAFAAAQGHYRRLVEDPGAPLSVRRMAQYQIVRAHYQLGDYPEVVAASEELVTRFPRSEYVESALYDRGWAYYYLGRHRQAIAAFDTMLTLARDVLKIDRAVFQKGESHFSLGQYPQARSQYAQLVAKYDFTAMTDKELQAMHTARIRGLVQETTRELVAKAQIRIGDAWAAEGSVDAAIGAYSLVPGRYPQEAELVQKSYDNLASMLLERQGPDAGIAVLRRAIDQVPDPLFRGRAELRIAQVLYQAGRYGEALAELRVYVRGYGDQAASVGYTLDRVWFLMAESLRQEGTRALAAGDSAGAAQAHAEAADTYRSLLARYATSARCPEARYGLGQVHFATGRVDSARALFAAVVALHPQSPVVPHALNWEGRSAFALRDLDGARAVYERLLTGYPGFEYADQVRKDLGLVLKAAGRPDEALAAFAEVAADSPLWPRVQAEMGDLLLAAGMTAGWQQRLRLDEAIVRAQVQEDGETASELHYIAGRLAREEGDTPAQIGHFSAALETTHNPQLEEVAALFRGLARYQAGAAADATGDSARATEHFAGAVEDLDRVLADGASPEVRAVAYRTRGVALTRLGRSAEAVSTYRLLIGAAAS
ncbi:MAG: tetratricopeptide repeat protein, partial [Candidatus Latescibacterota bacterium]